MSIYTFQMKQMQIVVIQQHQRGQQQSIGLKPEAATWRPVARVAARLVNVH